MKSMLSVVVALFVVTAAACRPGATARQTRGRKDGRRSATAGPKPGPEQKRIGYFAGQWTFQGEAKPSPWAPEARSPRTETCEWFAGGFQLVCKRKELVRWVRNQPVGDGL